MRSHPGFDVLVRETGMGPVVPLHGQSGMVPCQHLEAFHRLRHLLFVASVSPSHQVEEILAVDVFVLVDGPILGCIDHADFLALIDEESATHCAKRCRQHLGRHGPEFRMI